MLGLFFLTGCSSDSIKNVLIDDGTHIETYGNMSFSLPDTFYTVEGDECLYIYPNSDGSLDGIMMLESHEASYTSFAEDDIKLALYAFEYSLLEQGYDLGNDDDLVFDSDTSRYTSTLDITSLRIAGTTYKGTVICSFSTDSFDICIYTVPLTNERFLNTFESIAQSITYSNTKTKSEDIFDKLLIDNTKAGEYTH
jgi:hypothetical protein